MVDEVNPPPEVPLPLQFFEDDELRAYFEAKDRILFQLYIRSGGSTTNLISSGNDYLSKQAASINDIRQQIGSGDFLTSDETGFTVDLDTLTVDMDEA